MKLSINDQRARDLARLLRTEDVLAEHVVQNDVLVLGHAIVRVHRTHIEDTVCWWFDDDENGGGNPRGSMVRILARDILLTGGLS